jgi:Ni/Co efflux regulator RcnB
MFARTAVGIVCASALVTAGAAPAMAAQQDRNRHALEVTVCKQVRDRGHDHDHDHDRNRRFDIQVRTDRDSTDFRLRDHECRSMSLDFRRNSFSLEESRNRGDSVDFRVHGDVEQSESRDHQLRVRFDDHQNRPRVFVMVTNREHDHGHGGRVQLSR